MDNTKLPPNTIFTATPVDLDPLEMSPIIFASINNKIPMIKGLIRKGVDVNEINEYGVSALYLACQEGHREIASLLIDAGARVNCVEKSLCTPLHQACRSGDAEIVKLLISKIAPQSETTCPLKSHEFLSILLISSLLPQQGSLFVLL